MPTSFNDPVIDENSSPAAEEVAEPAPPVDPVVAALLHEREGYLRKATVKGADEAKWLARAELVDVELAKKGYAEPEAEVERAEAAAPPKSRATKK
jgi:hypothetical protein